MTVADRVRLKREELGLSQEELAKKMGYANRSAVSSIETSGDKITLKKVEKVAKALHCDISYLMGWESLTDNENIWFNQKVDEYQRLSLQQVYERFGYNAYATLFIYECLDDSEREQVIHYAKYTAEKKGIIIPSEEDIKNEIKKKYDKFQRRGYKDFYNE